jgi:glycosyltransferase involved in cell wall biosynthesis
MENKILIIIPVHNKAKFISTNLECLHELQHDVLLIDDGSTDNTYAIIKEQSWIKYIKHELPLGPGSCFITGYEYARDMGYDVIILFDNYNTKYKEEIDRLMENIVYGYDIVSSSRILENYDHDSIQQEKISITADITDTLRGITNFDLTDPLSGIKALRVESLKNMELTESTDGIFLQLWIQAHYFGLTIIEIPAQSSNGFGSELTAYDDPLGYLLTLIETENYLYPKTNLN